MPVSYLLKNMEDALWRRFKVRAARDGINMRSALNLLIDGYASGRLRITAAHVPEPPATINPESHEETVTNG